MFAFWLVSLRSMWGRTRLVQFNPKVKRKCSLEKKNRTPNLLNVVFLTVSGGMAMGPEPSQRLWNWTLVSTPVKPSHYNKERQNYIINGHDLRVWWYVCTWLIGERIMKPLLCGYLCLYFPNDNPNQKVCALICCVLDPLQFPGRIPVVHSSRYEFPMTALEHISKPALKRLCHSSHPLSLLVIVKISFPLVRTPTTTLVNQYVCLGVVTLAAW